MPELEPVLPDNAVRVLLEETDPVRRARAHFVLGQRALARDHTLVARDHLSEAIELDPTDERPRTVLKTLEPLEPRPRGLASMFSFLRRS
jgi:hypothetical protein